MKAVFAISILSPLALFGAFADKDWAKRTFAPTNAASVAEAAAVTNAQQDARILALEGVSRSKIEAGSGQSLNRISADRTVVGDGVQLGRLALESSVSSKQDALSPAQTNAVDSGVTAQKVSSYDSHVAAFSRHVTSADKLRWDAKQDAIPDYTTTAAVHSIVSSDVASWATAGNPRPSGTVSDVKVNGTSVIAGGIANVSVPVTDVRTGGVSIVSNGIADFTFPDVELPTTWAWAKGLTGFPAWITDASPLSPYVKSQHQTPTTYPGEIGKVVDYTPVGSGVSVSKWGVDYAEHSTSALSADVAYNSAALRAYSDVGPYLRTVEFEYGWSNASKSDAQGGGRVVIRTVSALDSVPISTERIAFLSDLPTAWSWVTGLSGFPSWITTTSPIKTKTSELTNDSGFITSSDIPSIPTKVSDLQIDNVTTNVIREVTGTFWDPGLTVTWRMFCSNGCFYVSAITNVNVTGVTP